MCCHSKHSPVGRHGHGAAKLYNVWLRVGNVVEKAPHARAATEVKHLHSTGRGNTPPYGTDRNTVTLCRKRQGVTKVELVFLPGSVVKLAGERVPKKRKVEQINRRGIATLGVTCFV